MAPETCGCHGRRVCLWRWKDEQLQQAWWTLVCCQYDTMHAGL